MMTSYDVISFSFPSAPDGFDAVSVQGFGPTYIIVSWDLPAYTNGILTSFRVYRDGALVGVLPPSVLSYNVTGLLPFTTYDFSAAVCTKAGCAESVNKSAMTAEDGMGCVVEGGLGTFI